MADVVRECEVGAGSPSVENKGWMNAFPDKTGLRLMSLVWRVTSDPSVSVENGW